MTEDNDMEVTNIPRAEDKMDENPLEGTSLSYSVEKKDMTAIKPVEEVIKPVERNIDTVEGKIETVEKDIKTVEAAIKTVEDQIVGATSVQQDIEKLEEKIEKLEKKIEGQEKKIETAAGDDQKRLMDEMKQLMDEMKQLMDEKMQLRKEKMLLMDEGPPLKRTRLEMYGNFPTPSKCSTSTISQQRLIFDHIKQGAKVNVHGPHVSLFWEPFGEFIDFINGTATPEPQVVVIASNLMADFSGPYGESDRQQALYECLKRLGIGTFESIPVPNGKTDLTLKLHDSPCINFEVKAGLGKGGDDPDKQNTFYYLHLTKHRSSLDPMLLVSISGWLLQVYGAVHGERHEILVDPLGQPLSRLHVPDDLVHSATKLIVFFKQ